MYLIDKNFEICEYDLGLGRKIKKNLNLDRCYDLFCYNENYIFLAESNSSLIYRARISDIEKNESLEKENVEKDLKENNNINASKNNLKVEIFYDLNDKQVIKLICNEEMLIMIDKKGCLNKLSLTNQSIANFECKFMIRNCHINNLAILGEANLLILDPIRLSLNKLNIINGSEIIIIHSQKFLCTIKYLFTNGMSKIFLIDFSGTLFFYNDNEKKISQIGNSYICKDIEKYAIYKNFLLGQLNDNTILKININDGINIEEIPCDYIKDCDYFLADNVNLILVKSKVNTIYVLNPNDNFNLVKIIKYDFSKINALTIFKKTI